MRNLRKVGVSVVLLLALLLMAPGVAGSQEEPKIPPDSVAYVVKVSENRDCLAVYRSADRSQQIDCLRLCKEVVLTGNSSDIWVEISAPVRGWVDGLALDPNPRVCSAGSITGAAPYVGDFSDVPDDYAVWWGGPGYAWYWPWWWHHRHHRHHFFHDHHPGHHHGHVHPGDHPGPHPVGLHPGQHPVQHLVPKDAGKKHIKKGVKKDLGMKKDLNVKKSVKKDLTVKKDLSMKKNLSVKKGASGQHKKKQ